MVPSTEYTKPHKASSKIIEELREKGLSIQDEEYAIRFIDGVGYSRLRIYLQSRRDLSKLTKPFHANVTFREIADIYLMDEKLRALVFPYCARIEVIFRNSVSEVLTKQYGPHPYQCDIFKSDTSAQDAMKLMSEVYFAKLSQDQRARHYFKKYGQPTLPPIWTMKEFFTFEKASRFYGCLNDSIKVEISRRMNIDVANHDILTSWIKSIIDLRNVCAHHDRLFNRKFQKQPQNLRKADIFVDADNKKLAGILKCIDHLGGNYFQQFDSFSKARGIINANKYVAFKEAGFL